MAKMREVCLLVGEDGASPANAGARSGENDVVLWSDASDSPVALPDSRARWEAIWSRRERIVEIAHSHPVGPEAFSHEDDTTMKALVTALGRPITFSVVAPNGMVRCTIAPATANEHYETSLVECEREPWWASLLRLASSMSSTSAPQIPKTPDGVFPAAPEHGPYKKEE